jgi:hypothetical protein
MISTGQKTKKELMEGIDCIKSRKIDHNTIEYTEVDGTRKIRLHQTDIITFTPKETVILNSGTWRTPTTKDRMNKFAPEIRIYQEKGQWYANGHLFYDGITFKSGKLVSKEITPDNKNIKKVKAQIKSYCNLITKENLPISNGGDCWYCCMSTEDKTSLGDAVKNHDHLQEHLKEGYLHGSILVNAMRAAGYRDEQIGFHFSMKLIDTFKRALRKYLQKRLLPDLAA